MNNPTITRCFIVEDTCVIAIVETEDAIIHTDERPHCDDPFCPCNATPDDNEAYPLARRTFEYDIPESRNGRTYRTTSSRVDWTFLDEDAEYPLGTPHRYED